MPTETNIVEVYYPLVDKSNFILSKRSCNVDDVRRMIVNELQKLGKTRDQAIDEVQRYIDNNGDDPDEALEILGILDM